MALLEVKELEKVYTTRFGGNKVRALTDVSFTVQDGEFIAIMGESGSGKTTLLNLLATLDRPTGGSLLLSGKDLSNISDSEISTFRRENLGFVFQDFNLLDTFSVKDNILLPLVLSGETYEKMEPKLLTIAKRLSIQELLDKFPYEISGGQKQRTAVARAIITSPRIIFADEPTGALDSRTGDELMQVFKQINETGQTILMVTHSIRAASYAQRVLFLRDGAIFHQVFRRDMDENEMHKEISDALVLLNRGDHVR